MFTQKNSLIRISELVLMFLFVFGFNDQLFAEQQMTKREQAEERLKQQTAELAAANEKLQQQIAERKQAEELLKQQIAELKAANERLQQLTTQQGQPEGKEQEIHEPVTQVSLFEMSLEDLMEVPVGPSVTLTETRRRLTPAAVTTITEKMIAQSGARSLNEVFDIFVPNVQIIRHHSDMEHVGIRGVPPSDVKYLLLVNGRVMNNRSMTGAVSERDLPMLSDIHHINFVRGPGSVIHGPGAVIGVIDIVTHNTLTFEGTDVTVRKGFVEDFLSLELRHGLKLGDEKGLFFYFGTSNYYGADQKHAPYVFGKSFVTPDGFPDVVAGEPVKLNTVDDHESYRDPDIDKRKFHIEYTDGPLSIWARYTRGGIKNTNARSQLATRDQTAVDKALGWRSSTNDLEKDDTLPDGRQAGYQQWTVFGGYTHEFSDELSVDFELSYDMHDFEKLNYRLRVGTGTDYKKKYSMREDEYHARVLGRWTPNDKHSVAAGFEYSREIFGRRSPGYPYLPARTERLGVMKQWETNTYSLLGEHQWSINDQWTTFLGARLDKHSYTEWMFSPRAALAYTPNEKNTFKLIANQSVRRNKDEELRAQWLTDKSKGDEETIRAYEFRYDRQHTDNLWFGGGLFYQDLDLLAWDGDQLRITSLGEFDAWGFEVEASYRTDKTRIELSHAFTKLIDFKLSDPTAAQGYSAAPYGYGNDLASWSNHVSKLYARYDIRPKWTADGSLRIYWGFPGAEDYSDYNYNEKFQAGAGKASSYTLAEPGYEKAWRANIYLNLGLEHRPLDNLTIRLDAHNILGWFDKDLNKRNYHLRMSEYRSEAAAISLTLRYMF